MAVPGYEVAGFVETIMQMVPIAVASAIGMGACLVATRALFPTVAKESHDALAPSRRFFVSQCVVSGLHALVSGPAGTAVLQQLLFSDPPAYAACPAQPNLATVAAPPLAVWTCGFTCGYFVYDSIVMLVYPEFTRAELGNPALMYGHHLISLLVWPYCIASGRAVVFVSFFLFTELTNIGQALFLVLNKGKMLPSLETPVGLVWALSFLGCRIVTIPWLLKAFAEAVVTSDCGMAPFDRALGALTVPLPILLNVYWFALIARKAMRIVAGSKPPPKEAKAE
ncbi:hypothetical protein EMIHUDRAFT_434359 [Emiliania huxleyi CCMP1516]|uniref:TLC domain-containing protein n=3 Tax=Emiliania huxleyi TaxID=2903 RepID=A0A0D3K5L7_EMIH1|nr:hypothetical protein EMIHUDRAFT_444105 [Emiliania huxleyi CCMP1516]XP_005783481.1 hypothetical protein EMIHUDRAFT_434359 [Emiliania huxleyi CCMP1516]EOD23449.1 hypothetical protein EMIHUDRAFT_444105 [Emiliania huxleyi CCMP1516]EOD31052.1 hypothetical protein EMIHUDRAFT_434359 [Emiliania huxleyi CCMP1516]|eukprot:XP_005775878.1 hypothetical protein EMIHUDRAFT_444105 [Emiliania huxleyi CCMP1516]